MPVLSIREAAKRLKVDNRTLRRWITNGTVQAHRGVNGRQVIEVSEIEKIEEERSTQTSKEDDQTSRIIEMRLEDLEKRIARLEAKAHVEVEYRIPEQQEGMEVREFCAVHNIHINQVHRVVGNVSFVDQAGHDAMWREYHLKTRFRRCERCPT